MGAEDAADDGPGRLGSCHREPAGDTLGVEGGGADAGLCASARSRSRSREVPPMQGDLAMRLGGESRIGQQPPVGAEEPEHLTVVPQGCRSADGLRRWTV